MLGDPDLTPSNQVKDSLERCAHGKSQDKLSGLAG
jgi:hypothetical protein